MVRARRWSLAVVVLAAVPVLFAACAPMRVESFVERSADLSRLRTYMWATSDLLFTGDPRLDSNPFFQRRIQNDVEAGLAARGLYKVTDGMQADVVVHYHASVTQQISTSGLDQESPQCTQGAADCAPVVYEKGALVLDLVDRATGKLMWRGWANTTLDNVIDNQRALEETIDDAVRRILARLPGAAAS